ncbi:MAG TPA: ornithine cyclodeaminase family protein [Candidatus Dormibacteraeota bacterium]|jgi:ornithine cyclodeaminase/alanine dehydrogenase-like protein (mu-crystallin family)|nr:ornithine cyclodeaminase family protein [Candidatus Dormibacteraeota bacterium]
MEVLVLNGEQVAQLMPMPECIKVMRDALAALARGEALVPLRTVMRVPGVSGFLGLMPGYISPREGREGALGLKAVSVFPGNASRGIDTHQGAVLLFEADTGRLSALLDGAAITAIRTAAVSGVATDVLARPDASELAVLGAGVQARTHIEAIAAVRPLRRVRIWSRNPEHAAALASELRRRFGFPIEAAPSAEAAVREADVVATVTASPEPILKREWLKEGVHINAVGSSIPTTREIDTATMVAARLFVDRRESALAEAGDLLIAMREDAVTGDHVQAELGDVIIGKNPGRRSPRELTLFKSLGLAVEDVASAAYLVRRARETGTGQTVQM